MVWLPLTLFAITVLISARLGAKTEGYYGTIFVFALSFFVYNMAIPLEMLITGDGWARDDHGITFMEPDRLYQIIWSAFWGYLGFACGYLAFFKHPKGAYTQPVYQPLLTHTQPLPLTLVAFAALSLLAFLFFARSSLSVMGDYEAWMGLRYSSGGLSFSVELAYTAMAMLAFALIYRYKLGILSALLAVAPCVLWGMYSNDKDPILLGALAYAPVVWRLWPSKSLRGFVLMWLGAGLLGVLGVIAFSVHRGGGDVHLGQYIQEKGFFRRTDPAGPLLSLNDTLQDMDNGDISYLYGKSYVQGLVMWLPKRIWPSRPLDLSEQYARTKIDDWSEGMGVGFSLLSESFLNFGWLGPFIQYFIIGVIWRFIWFSVLWRVLADKLLFYSLYMPVGFYIVIKMHRGSFSAIITGLTHIIIPVLVLHGFLVFVQQILRLSNKDQK